MSYVPPPISEPGPRRIRRRRLLWAVAIVVLLVVAVIVVVSLPSSDNGSSSTNGTSTSEPAPTQPVNGDTLEDTVSFYSLLTGEVVELTVPAAVELVVQSERELIALVHEYCELQDFTSEEAMTTHPGEYQVARQLATRYRTLKPDYNGLVRALQEEPSGSPVGELPSFDKITKVICGQP